MIYIVNEPTLSGIISGLKRNVLGISEEAGDDKYKKVHSVIPDQEYKNFTLYSHEFGSFPSGVVLALIYFHERTTRPYAEEITELISQIAKNKQISDQGSPFDVNSVGIIVPSNEPQKVLIFQKRINGEPYKTQSPFLPGRSQISDYGEDPFEYSDILREANERNTLDTLRGMNFSAMYVNLGGFNESFYLFMQKPDMKDEYADLFRFYPKL